MNNGETIPEETIEALARGLHKETSAYGFKQVDYLRFVNTFLDVSMMNGLNNHGNKLDGEKQRQKTFNFEHVGLKSLKLPLAGDRVTIRRFDPEKDQADFERWIRDVEGRLSCFPV